MLKDYAYVTTKSGMLKGLLTNITKTTVLTTSEAPTWYLKRFGGNAIKKKFINSTLKTVGIKGAKWINFPKASSGTSESREKYLGSLKNRFTV